MPVDEGLRYKWKYLSLYIYFCSVFTRRVLQRRCRFWSLKIFGLKFFVFFISLLKVLFIFSRTDVKNTFEQLCVKNFQLQLSEEILRGRNIIQYHRTLRSRFFVLESFFFVRIVFIPKKTLCFWYVVDFFHPVHSKTLCLLDFDICCCWFSS